MDYIVPHVAKNPIKAILDSIQTELDAMSSAPTDTVPEMVPDRHDRVSQYLLLLRQIIGENQYLDFYDRLKPLQEFAENNNLMIAAKIIKKQRVDLRSSYIYINGQVIQFQRALARIAAKLENGEL